MSNIGASQTQSVVEFRPAKSNDPQSFEYSYMVAMIYCNILLQSVPRLFLLSFGAFFSCLVILGLYLDIDEKAVHF